jgi:hypothetical protein
MNAPLSPTALATVDTARAPTGRDLILQADNLNAIVRVAEMMANSKQAVPKHLRGNPGGCMAVAMQAMRWNMDPFALATKTYTADSDGPVAYEGQAIIAALNNSPLLTTRLYFDWGGPWEKIVGRFVWKESTKKTDENTGKPKKYLAKAWDDNEEQGLWCTVTATLAGEREPRSLQLFLMQARVRNSPLWVEDPRQQLAYLAARRWGRLYAPDVIMGVYTPDELEEPGEKFMGPADVVGAPPPPPPPEHWPADLFEQRLPEWHKAVQTKKATADQIVAKARSKHPLTPEQEAAIRAVPKPEATDVAPKVTYAQVADALNKAPDRAVLDEAADLIGEVADEQQRGELRAIYDRRCGELTAA